MRKRKPLQSAATILNESIKEIVPGYNPQLLHLENRWHEVLGEYLAQQAPLVNIQDGVIWLFCSHPAIRQEILQTQGDILAKASRLSRLPGLKEIRFTRQKPQDSQGSAF